VFSRSTPKEPLHESRKTTRAGVSDKPRCRSSQGLGPGERGSWLWLLRENHRGSNDHTYVLVVRRRQDLLERVIPFFERNPLLSCKQDEFNTFAGIVRAMARGEHLALEGFERLAAEALQMNGGGRYRRRHRAQSPESSETICQAPSQN
jgi:hypothetical protein